MQPKQKATIVRLNENEALAQFTLNPWNPWNWRYSELAKKCPVWLFRFYNRCFPLPPAPPEYDDYICSDCIDP